MDFNLDKYKGTIVKLINIGNSSELYGFLEEQDEVSGKIMLNKAILSVNRMIADGAGTTQSIIKYEYSSEDGNVITVPAATVYPNAPNGKHITIVDLSSFLFIPLYDNSYNSEKKLDKDENIVQIKATFENYIEYIYNTYSDVLVDINELTKDIMEDEQTKSEKEDE